MTFREIYDAHLGFVWRSLRRLGVPDADAQDAAQEVFLVVHRRLHEFEWRAKITTWLFRICLRVASDRRDRAHVRREVSTAAQWFDRADAGADTAAQAEKREAAVILEKALGRMDLDQRAVFALFELEALTGDEIAETLAIPVGTVYSRLRAARGIFQATVRKESEIRPASTLTRGVP